MDTRTCDVIQMGEELERIYNQGYAAGQRKLFKYAIGYGIVCFIGGCIVMSLV